MNSREKMGYDYEQTNQLIRKVNIAAIIISIAILGLLIFLATIRK